MSIFKLPTHKITMALVGLFFIFVFLLPSVSLAIEGDPDDRLPTPPSIPLDPRVDLPPSGLPAAPDPAPERRIVNTPAGPQVVTTPPPPEIPLGADEGTTLRKWLHELVVTFFGVLTAAFGYFFDYTVEHYIVGFGDAYKNSGTGFVIDDLWGMVRNIFNLTLIFGLVYIGFQMILGLNNSAQRSIGYLVAAALLVNFSLFITKFVVDFSNLAATQIYQAMVGDVGGSISTTFTNIISLSKIVDVPANSFVGATLGYIFGLMLVFVVTAFVFAAGAVMILLRYIGLNFYLVFSPLLFLGWVFPSMSGYSKKYWSGFLGKAFFAPAFMFMLYLSLRVIKGYGAVINGSITGIFTTDGVEASESALGMFSFYIMVIGFLLASLVVAQKMGATGATASIAVGQRLRKGAQGILYRTFVGRAAKGGMNFIDKTGMSNWVGGRTLRGGLNKAYKYGAGGTGLAQTRSDIESHKAEVTKNRSRMTSAASVATANADIEAGLSSAPRLKKLRDKIKAGSTLTTSEQTEKDNLERIEAKMRTAATGLSKTEIENMSSKKRNEISHLFTAQQAKEFAKSDKVGTNDINSFTAARKNAIVAKITIPASTAGGTPTLDVTAVSKLTEAQLATLGGDWLMENAHLLTPSQFDEIRKTGKDNSVFTEEQAESFSDKRKNVINNIVANLNIPENNRIFSQYLEAIKTKHKEIASLPIDALLNPITAGYMNSKVLKEIDTKSDIRRTDKIRIAANIRGIPAGVGAADDGKKYLNTPKVVADGEWA